MKLIESFLKGKRPDPDRCEDGWVVTPDFVAVVDGSTSKVAGGHGGLTAMRLVTEAIRTLPPAVRADEAVRRLTAVLAAGLTPRARAEAQYRPTCSAVIYSAAHREVWMVGDCQCRFGGRTVTHPKLVDDVLTTVRCDVTDYLLRQRGHSVAELLRDDPGRSLILDALREQTNFQNDPNPRNPFRYPVLDGTPVDPALVPVIPLPADADQLILASDGYPVLCDTLAATEAELARLLAEDPLCISLNRATKCLRPGQASFDDRCYLRLAI